MNTPSIHTAVTWLFVPATRPERVERALASGAGAVIVDLEDAVATGDKARARGLLRAGLPEQRPVPLVVRVNAGTSPEHAEDLALCAELRPDAVVLPKAESGTQVRAVATVTGLPVLALVETARGLLALADLRTEVARLLLGTIDLALDLGSTAEAVLDIARSDLVRHSAVAGLPAPVDGVTTAVHDHAAIGAAARHARAFGFGGKMCIHPAQLRPVATAFLPGPDEISWARRVVEAGERGGAAVQVDGEMVDTPVLERARRLLARAREVPGGDRAST